jgi:hypothetical protein
VFAASHFLRRLASPPPCRFDGRRGRRRAHRVAARRVRCSIEAGRGRPERRAVPSPAAPPRGQRPEGGAIGP